MVTVPNLVGMDVTTDTPKNAVTAVGLTCGTLSWVHSGSTNYKITVQSPAAGSSVQEGTAVAVTAYNSSFVPPPVVVWGT